MVKSRNGPIQKNKEMVTSLRRKNNSYSKWFLSKIEFSPQRRRRRKKRPDLADSRIHPISTRYSLSIWNMRSWRLFFSRPLRSNGKWQMEGVGVKSRKHSQPPKRISGCGFFLVSNRAAAPPPSSLQNVAWSSSLKRASKRLSWIRLQMDWKWGGNLGERYYFSLWQIRHCSLGGCFSGKGIALALWHAMQPLSTSVLSPPFFMAS